MLLFSIMYILCESKNKSKLVCYQEFAYYVLYKQHGNSFVRQRKRRKLLPLLTNKGEDYCIFRESLPRKISSLLRRQFSKIILKKFFKDSII